MVILWSRATRAASAVGTLLAVSLPSVSAMMVLRRHGRAREQVDAEADRIAQRGARAGHADLHLLHQPAAELQVGGERDEAVGRIAEHHDADPVALALGEELVEHLLHRGEAVDLGCRRDR